MEFLVHNVPWPKHIKIVNFWQRQESRHLRDIAINSYTQRTRVMKRAVEEASECKKPSIITFGDVDREAITKLRNDIRSCVGALQGGCDGVQRFNPQYFEDLIDALSDDIVNCDRELEKGWFGGFVRW